MAAKTYAATFTPGLEGPVAALLTRAGAQQVKTVGGLAQFIYAGKPDMPYLGTLFAIAAQGRAKNIPDWLRELSSRTGWLAKLPSLTQGADSFRIVTMEEGRLVKVPPRIMDWLERAIADVTGMTTDRARPGIELWASVRTDGTALFMARVTRHAAYDRALPAGALKPEMCALLAAMSQATKGDRALEPYAGHGGIVRALADRGAEVECGDNDPARVRELADMAKKSPRIHARELDALALPFENAGFDIVVTDPPWGEHAPLSQTPHAFMAAVVGELSRVLKPTARIVLLSSLKEETTRALAMHGFEFDRHDVLINGRKAAVFDGARGT